MRAAELLPPFAAASSTAGVLEGQYGAAPFTQPCTPRAGSRAEAAGMFSGMLPVCCGSMDPAWERCSGSCSVNAWHGKKKNLPFQLLHYRGWRPGGRESLYCLLLGRGKKSSGPQLPRKVEAKALSCITDRSSSHEIPLLIIPSSPGNPRFPSHWQSV